LRHELERRRGAGLDPLRDVYRRKLGLRRRHVLRAPAEFLGRHVAHELQDLVPIEAAYPTRAIRFSSTARLNHASIYISPVGE
jgi:hypothetical protein